VINVFVLRSGREVEVMLDPAGQNLHIDELHTAIAQLHVWIHELDDSPCNAAARLTRRRDAA
jgi:hypothetical protein